MKITFILKDFSSVVHVGGGMETRTATMEIPHDSLPNIVREHIEYRAKCKPQGPHRYETMEIGIHQEA